MDLNNQDLHQICNVTSIFRFNDAKSLCKIANVNVLAILNWPSLLKFTNEPVYL